VALPSSVAWIPVALLGSFSTYVISMNVAAVYLGLFRREHHSLGPLLGGGAGAIAMLLCPLPGVRSWAWVPLVVDPGCLYASLAFAYSLLTESRRR